MQISQDLTLWLKSEGMVNHLRLEAGEIVRALVKDVTSEQAILLIKGQSVEAKAEMKLFPGQRVQLKVQDNLDGRIVFQLVEDDGSKNERSSFSRTSAENILSRFNLPSTANNLLLAQSLVEIGIDEISREEFQYLARFLGNNAGKNEALALAYLFQKNLPIKNFFLSSLSSFIQGFISSDLDQSRAFFQLEQLFSLLEEGEILPKEIHFTSRDGQEIGQKLSNLANRLGIDYEGRLAREILSGSNLQTKDLSNAKEAILSIMQNQESSAKLSQELLSASRVLLETLTGLQLLNWGMTEEGKLYLMGWLGWDYDGGQNPFYLSFFQDRGKGDGPGNPAHQIMIKTSTPRLGSILGELRFFGNKISVEITVENAKIQEFFNQHCYKLEEMMEDLPWRVSVLPCRLASRGKEKEEWLKEYLEPTTAQKVDIRL